MPDTLRGYPHIFVGGVWRVPSSGRTFESIDPSTGQAWATIAQGDVQDVEAAVDAAREALHGPWSKVPSSDRGKLLRRLARLVASNIDSLAQTETRDNGKVISDTRAEISRAADWLTFFGGAADKFYGETIPVRPDAISYTVREPVGVVAAITPWNSPLQQYSWKLGPALATGNTVVLKPSTQTSATALELAKLTEEAGFPSGVINVVPGAGSDVGAALVTHRGVDKVSFTGDSQTARAVMRSAADTLKRLTLECGGKSPHIIFDDADVESALTVAVQSAFRSTGQSCSAGSRLFVQRPIYSAVVRLLADRTRRIRVGLPLDPRSHLGPQASAEQLQTTLSYIELGREEGARLVAGGNRLEDEGLRDGFFVEPTVFADVDNRSRLAQEEIFGPVLAVIPFDTEDEVVAAANDTKYGLVAGLWTRDVGRAHRVAGAIRAGLVSINTFRPVHWMLPYGGFKLSGLGRENGMEALRHYTELKTIFVELSNESPQDRFR